MNDERRIVDLLTGGLGLPVLRCDGQVLLSIESIDIKCIMTRGTWLEHRGVRPHWLL